MLFTKKFPKDAYRCGENTAQAQYKNIKKKFLFKKYFIIFTKNLTILTIKYI